MSKKVKLRVLREELQPRAAQEEIARNANLSLSGYQNAERGKDVLYSTAMSILEGLNQARAKRGLPPLKLEDLELKLA